MENINIGKKIAEFRNAQNLTIKSLAEKASITSSMLSQIERGLANPSINSLKMISKALNIQLFTLFIEDNNTEDLIVRKDDRKTMNLESNHGEIISYELLSPDLKGEIEFSLMELTPQSQSSINPLAHEGEEVALVLSGSIDIFLNDQKVTLYEGDSIRIPKHTAHRWINNYQLLAKVVFAVTPPTF